MLAPSKVSLHTVIVLYIECVYVRTYVYVCVGGSVFLTYVMFIIASLWRLNNDGYWLANADDGFCVYVCVCVCVCVCACARVFVYVCTHVCV